MHVAYAILMTTPWLIGTMLFLAGIGAIIGKLLTERTLYLADVRAYQEEKAAKDKEALEDLTDIFEEMLERIERNERRKMFDKLYIATINGMFSKSNIIPTDMRFDFSDVRYEKNVYCGKKVHRTFTKTKETGNWLNIQEIEWNQGPHLHRLL